ncbi:MAG: hypothetical protein PVJ75_08170 [Chloroflexota bacterium]|jgi:hypothetical protein
MVDVTIHDKVLDVEVEGIDKILSLRSHLEIPLKNVKQIHKDTAATERWWHNLDAPGLRLPDMVMAGTFYKDGRSIFCDIRNPDRSVIIELDGEKYNELIVEVNNPQAVISRVEAALESLDK